MSKGAPKKNSLSPTTEVLRKPISNLKAPSGNLPAMRDVSNNMPALQPNTQNADSNMVAVYKDLKLEEKINLQNSNRNLIFAISIFIVLGLGLFIGKNFSGAPASPSANVNNSSVGANTIDTRIPANAEVISQSYHYDKNCYLSETGEHICVTKTSQKYVK